MVWVKYKKHSKPRNRLISFTREQIYFSGGLVDEYLKNVEWVVVYYDLKKKQIIFIPTEHNCNGAMKLGWKGAGKVINALGIYGRIGVKIDKVKRFDPIVDSNGILVKYGDEDIRTVQ